VVTTIITIIFGASMDASTINDKTIRIADGTPGLVAWRGGRTATLLPKGGLKKGTTYTIVVSADCTTEDGQKLGADHTFSFTTEQPDPSTKDTLAPTIVSTLPGANETGVAIDTAIGVTFSEDVDPKTVTSASFFVGTVPGTIAVTGKTITFSPSGPLQIGTAYQATVTTAITDLAGNPLAMTHQWGFTTGGAPGTAAPTLSAVSPANGAANVPLTTTITLTFSAAIAPASVSGSSVALEANGGHVSCTVSVNGATVTLTPNAPLSPSTNYTIDVSGAVTDTVGNHVAPAISTFTTN
jgi:hypothetical protein